MSEFSRMLERYEKIDLVLRDVGQFFLQISEGRDRLEMLVELRVQYCRELFQDSFETYETFYGVQLFSKSKILSLKFSWISILKNYHV